MKNNDLNLCDIKTIKQLLLKHGFRFSKSLGQNFLTIKEIPERIVKSSGFSNETCVVEVGTGIGCLTKELLKNCKQVLAIEIDKTLFPILDETLEGFDNFKIVEGDILKVDIKKLLADNNIKGEVSACANLPYYITSPAISALIDARVFQSITVMVQKEVAQRICANKASKDYSAFSVYINYYAEPKILFSVSRGCFIPSPNVDSAVVSLKIREKPPVFVKDEGLFFKIVKAAFNQRRKTLTNALSAVFGNKIEKDQIESIIKGVGLLSTVRGEQLSLDDFANITNHFFNILDSLNNL